MSNAMTCLKDANCSAGTAAPVVRTARAADVDALYALSLAGGIGLTSLPADRDVLAAKLDASERAVASAEIREAGAAIILVVEMDDRMVGTSCIFPRVGAEWPFYSYRLTRQSARSQVVGRTQTQTLLNLVNDFDGEAEVGGLLIDPSMRGHRLGALAARARYLFIAAHRNWFGDKVIAELRGWQDGKGSSPVWEAVGRHFYAMEFDDADRTGAIFGNQIIADLGPRYPLYVSLLPADARGALGRPHDDGRHAYEMLLAEGFRAGDYVDIFDGGPTLVSDTDSIRTVRECCTVEVAGITGGGAPSLVAAGEGVDFRVARGEVGAGDTIAPDLAARLEVGLGDSIRHVKI